MDYKAIVLDLDGTLTNSKKEISPANLAALMKAQQKGIKIILASGRPTFGIVPLARQLQMEQYDSYILSYNGGKVIHYPSGKVIYQSVLSLDLIPQLYAAAKEQDVTIISYEQQYILTENPDNPYIAIESRLNKMEVKKVDNFIDAIQMPVPKCLIVGEPGRLESLEQQMQQQFGEQMNIFRSEPFFLELMPPNIDKAYSLNKLLEHLGCTAQEMIAFGDGFNDLSMIRFAGMGVAMANAQPIVKEAADYITLSNDEDGVADALEKLIFGTQRTNIQI